MDLFDDDDGMFNVFKRKKRPRADDDEETEKKTKNDVETTESSLSDAMETSTPSLLTPSSSISSLSTLSSSAPTEPSSSSSKMEVDVMSKMEADLLSKRKDEESKMSTSKTHTDASDKGSGNGLLITNRKMDFQTYQRQIVDEIPEDGCIHEICYPPQWDVEKTREELKTPLKIANPAKEYKFTLDSFQDTSIQALERNHSVLVAAHTSAGKTTIAEYAIALALRNKSRVVYTSPIKALSNQKYRELREEFGDVGLMTGDVTISPRASCLVMTTEILRNMLYRGSDVIKEAQWIIFDEIHYMRDRERGVVWEECIILLPQTIRFVFLSATIPNAAQFSCWISKLNANPCHVVYTDKRPVPLHHYMFPSGGEGLHLIVDEKGKFREKSFRKGIAQIKMSQTGYKKGKSTSKDGSDVIRIIKMIAKRRYDPLIVFSFSRRDCESYAQQLGGKLDFSSDDEKKMIEKIFHNAVDSLSEDDKKLPQVISILPLLLRGVGIHHSGLLPILKEATEVLFQEGLVKCLFATETFSMGLNMPAKTCLFTQCRKFDGKDFRYVSPGEYVQMSGRAGRRGIDERGIAILVVNENLEPKILKDMFKGQADVLNSSFHLGYNMLLNLIRVEEADPEYMIQRSFHNFQALDSLPKMKEKLKELRGVIQETDIEDEELVSECHDLSSRLNDLNDRRREYMNTSEMMLPYLQAGRLVRIRDDVNDWDWGCVVNINTIDAKGKIGNALSRRVVSPNGDPSKLTILDVLLHCADGTAVGKIGPECATPEERKNESRQNWKVVPCKLETVEEVSSVRIYLPHELRTFNSRQNTAKAIKDARRQYRGKMPLLDPIDDMRIKSKDFKKIMRRIESTKEQLSSHEIRDRENGQELLAQYEDKCKNILKEKLLVGDIQTIEKNQTIRKHLKSMKRVLRRLQFVDEHNVIKLKGRVACDISTADELLATELLFSGVFNELDVKVIVSLCSCLVFSEKVDQDFTIRDQLGAPFRKLKEIAKRVGEVCAESGVELDAEEYTASFVPHAMDITYSWCDGKKFKSICDMTQIFEGSIIRCLRRLDECLAELSSACEVIGNDDLKAKFVHGRELLKRDIVFAGSLYLQ